MPEADQPGKKLVGQWAVCAIAAAAARFVPVPLLDDAVRLRATQVAVVATLRANQRDYPSAAVEPLYAGADAGLGGTFQDARRYLKSVPRRVLLFPVRKYVAVFGAVKGVPTDVMQVLVLARTVHRCLGQGRLAGSDPKELRPAAAQIRTAFDRTISGLDLRLLTGALADALSQGKGLTVAAVGYARKAFSQDGADPALGPALDPSGELGRGAERVEEVLQRPEISRLLAEFDARFDLQLSERQASPRRG